MPILDRPRPYYVLCEYHAPSASWIDIFGSYSKAEIAEEKQSRTDAYIPSACLAVIITNGRTAAMIAKRDGIPTPNARAIKSALQIQF